MKKCWKKTFKIFLKVDYVVFFCEKEDLGNHLINVNKTINCQISEAFYTIYLYVLSISIDVYI